MQCNTIHYLSNIGGLTTNELRMMLLVDVRYMMTKEILVPSQLLFAKLIPPRAGGMLIPTLILASPAHAGSLKLVGMALANGSAFLINLALMMSYAFGVKLSLSSKFRKEHR